MTAVVVGTFTALAAPANAALSSVGPTDPGSLYPSYYTDANGLSLQLCEDGLPLCLAGPKPIQDVHAAGGDAESFYFHASVDDLGGTGFLVETALEAAYLGPGPDQEQTFQRRQASATGMRPGATYTITDPYGTYDCTADGAGRVQPAKGCRLETTPAPGNFTNALGGPIGPFLTWNTYGSAAGAPPAGYIGDNATPHLVTGSPTGFNKMRVSGPGIVGTCTDALLGTINNCQETDKIILQGKVQPGASAAVSASTWDFGNIAATAPATKTFTYKNTSSDGTSVNITGAAPSADTSTDYTVGGTCAPGPLLPGASCTVTVTYTPTGTSPDTGSVVISSDTPGIGDRTISFTGKSVGVPFIDTPAGGAALAFGSVGTGTTSTEEVAVIGNSGVGNLSLTSATITGTSAAHFKLGPTNTCATLVPEAGCEVGVLFAPTTNSGKTANLRLLFNDGTTLNVPLTGTGAAPTIPGAPTITGATVGQTTASITWTPPSVTGSSAISGYTVKAFSGTTQVGATQNLGATAQSASFSGLTANTTYSIQVQAVNGSGPGTVATRDVTTQAVPAPTAVTLGTLTQGDGQVTVRWTGGANATSYTVTAFVGQGTTAATSVTAAAGATSAVVGGLTNNTAYTFIVDATNSTGTTSSARSAAVTPTAPVTAPGAPTNVVATAGNAQATVNWTAPTNTGGAPLSEYRVQVRTGTTVVSTISAIAPSANSTVVTGLTNGTAYNFRVRALNTGTTTLGTLSVASNTVTPQAATTTTVPGAPTIGTAGAGAAGGTITATARWTAPTNTGGTAITGYVVRWQRLSATNTVLASGTFTAAAGATSLSPTLPATGRYRFAVRARNAVGLGVFSANSNIVTGQ